MEDLLHFHVALAVIICLNHISLPMEVLQILIWATGKSHGQGYIRCLLLHAWVNGQPLLDCPRWSTRRTNMHSVLWEMSQLLCCMPWALWFHGLWPLLDFTLPSERPVKVLQVLKQVPGIECFLGFGAAHSFPFFAVVLPPMTLATLMSALVFYWCLVLMHDEQWD